MITNEDIDNKLNELVIEARYRLENNSGDYANGIEHLDGMVWMVSGIKSLLNPSHPSYRKSFEAIKEIQKLRSEMFQRLSITA